MPFTPASRAVLRRQCACGAHTMGGGECSECQKKISVSGRPLQTKLAISEPGDAYEQEADRVADQVMRMSPADVNKRQNGSRAQPLVQRRASGESAAGLAEAPPIVHEVLNSPGQPLDTTTRAFFEPRFDHDFSHVRVHTDSHAANSAHSINALAYAAGRDVVFGETCNDISSDVGRRVLAHELTHVLQQGHLTIPRTLHRLSPAMCASGISCGTPDSIGVGGPTEWKLTLAVDREEEGLGRLKTGNVGHTWVKLADNKGEKYSYGFWPQSGFNASEPWKAVPGCVHHPDTAHEPPHATDYIDIHYKLTKPNYDKAVAHADGICKAKPDYSLFSYNCTTFAVDVAKAGGVSPPSSTTLAIHNPNALFEGIEKEKKKSGKAGSGSGGGKKTT